MQNKAIFIGATGQNVGKTTLCLGIIAGLKKRFNQVGFIKPVGQQHVKIDEHTVVDKDVVLFRKYFDLKSEWSSMSPVILPAGFTKDYINEKISQDDLIEKIRSSFKKIALVNDYTIVEGTGHIGVGSIINLNNAQVASLLGLDMVIIATGGIGSAYDDLSRNIALCEKYGVKIRGVILNRVLDEKKEMIASYFPKTLKKWNIPLIGCIPFNEFLSKPTVRDFEALFETSLISGEMHHYRHFIDFRLIAGSLEAYNEELLPNVLIITPATREDIIIETIKTHNALQKQGIDLEGGMILTGRQPPSERILNEIKKVDIPTLYAPVCSYDAMKMITSFIAKIRTKDTLKIEKAIKLVEDSINFDLFCSP